jgi:hypothetical protein
MITFTVEDGTGVTGANSYGSVADFDDYLSKLRGVALSQTPEQKEAALMFATTYMESTYVFRGVSKTTTQGLHFPASGYDCRNKPIPTNVVPAQIQQGCFEYAWRQLDSGGELQPDPDQAGAVSRQRDKLDVLETETEYVAGTQNRTIPSYPYADNLIRCFVSSGLGGSSFNVIRG